MTNSAKFSNQQMSEREENQYLSTLYANHYDTKLRASFEAKLATDYGVTRSSSNTVKTKRSTVIKRMFLGLSSIAAVVVFCLLVLPMLLNSGQNSTRQMASNFVTFERIEVTRDSDTATEVRGDFRRLFNAGKYQSAIDLIAPHDFTNGTDHYWIALAYFYTNQYEEAEQMFSRVEVSERSNLGEDFIWYRAINFIFLEKDQLAIPLLKELTNNSWRKEEAQLLLKSILTARKEK